mgnify:CR=1 FL=1
MLKSVLLLLPCIRAALLAPRSLPSASAALPASTRRVAAAHLLGLACFAAAAPAVAFDNAVSAEYKDKPKRPGTPPKDLGLAKRSINEMSIDADPETFMGVRGCDGKPNCFSTTGDSLLSDRILTGVDTLIPPWKPPAGATAPFKSLVEAVKAYTPGQTPAVGGIIDGGGFKVVKETDSYIYVQFEALKKGYIDDVEFAMGKDGNVQVRSASRVGQTDFGVNGSRLNFIAAALRKDGWTIDEITAKGYADYFNAAADAQDLTFDKDRRKGTEMEGGVRLERPSIG